MKSLIVKRSVVIAGQKTSVSLEDAFWNSLKEIARAGNMSLPDLLTAIASGRRHGNLSSAIRLFVLNFYEAVWRSLREIASYQDLSLLALRTTINSTRNQQNLSPAIRLFVLNFYREQLELQRRHNRIEALLRSPLQALH